eukprot:scaffold129078_cov45-Attheya_sp.AAC.1
MNLGVAASLLLRVTTTSRRSYFLPPVQFRPSSSSSSSSSSSWNALTTPPTTACRLSRTCYPATIYSRRESFDIGLTWKPTTTSIESSIRLFGSSPDNNGGEAGTEKGIMVERNTKTGDLIPLLAVEWRQSIERVEEGVALASSASASALEQAMERTIPLLLKEHSSDGASAVPFLCRYRVDVVAPLTTQQVHALRDKVERHESLHSKRTRALDALWESSAVSSSADDSSSSPQPTSSKKELEKRMLVCTSPTQLDELYAPFKPPSKGSLAERIASAHPDVVELMDRLWRGEVGYRNKELSKLMFASKKASDVGTMSLRDCAINVLATQLAANPLIHDVMMDIVQRECILSTTGVVVTEKKTKTKKTTTSKTTSSSGSKTKSSNSHDKKKDPTNSKYKGYFDFNSKAAHLRDHQVLAIRRGVQNKELKMSMSVTNADFIKRRMKMVLVEKVFGESLAGEFQQHKAIRTLFVDAIDDAWSRLLKRRSTTAVWREVCEKAERRAIADGDRSSLQEGSEILEGTPVVVALGNGHGSDESRSLIEEASAKCGIPVDIQLVNEAGAKLETKLSHASVDAVATVGVDGNSCSLELLRNVPGLMGKAKVAEGIVSMRPIKSRNDLKTVKGLGAKTFENCAAFIRLRPSDCKEDILDSTRVHPESYPLVHWILKTLKTDLEGLSSSMTSLDEEKKKLLISDAAKSFDLTTSRVENVMSLLLESVACNDPRLEMAANAAIRLTPVQQSLELCSPVATSLASDLSSLKDACPVKNVVGTVRNVIDFGAFVDIGCESNGLIHVSKLAPLRLTDLHVGQTLGVHILDVDIPNQRVSLAFAPTTDVPKPSNSQHPNRKRALETTASHPSKKRRR